MINPSMISESENTRILNHINEIANVGQILNLIGNALLVINVLLCIFTMKNVKNNKLLRIISIIMSVIILSVCKAYEFIGFGYSDLADAIQDWNSIQNNATIYLILCIIHFVIQLVIFIELIISIVKNKKKEEP